jgi:hypothetical protein
MALTKATNRMIEGASVNVKDYGAVGDGVTDDTAAFLNAVDAVGHLTVDTDYAPLTQGGNIIFIPAGKYLITDTIRFPSSVTFKGVGRGSFIMFTPTSPKTLFEPDPSKLGSGSTIHGVTFEDFTITAMNTDAQIGISSTTGTSAYTEYMSIIRMIISKFSVNGVYIGQLPTPSGSTYFNMIEHCQFWKNYINLYIDVWGGPTVVNGGYFIPSATSSYQIKNYHEGTTITGSSIDGLPLNAQIYTDHPMTITGIRREQADDSPNVIPFVEMEASNTLGSTFLGETVIQGGWVGQHGAILKLNNYISTGEDLSATNASGRYGIDIRSGNPVSAQELVPNGNIDKGVYDWTYWGSGSTMAYTTSHKLLGDGSIGITSDGSGSLSAIRKTIPAASLTPYVGTRLWVTWLIKSTLSEDYFVQLNGAGVTNPTYQTPADATVDIGDWKVFQASIQIKSAADLKISVFLGAGASSGDAVYLAGINAYWKGFNALPEAQPTVVFYDSTAPTTGVWNQGDIVWNDSVTAGGSPGWMCVASGTPGTWGGMAALT